MPEPPAALAVNVADCPKLKEVEGGETVTDGAMFTDTVMMFEVTVTGVVALSVMWSTKYHTPGVMLFDVATEQLGDVAPASAE